MFMPLVLLHCWLGGKKGTWPVKIKWCDAGVVICLGEVADFHMAQLMPVPLTICCSSKSRLVLSFRCWLTRVVLDKIQGRKTCMLCVLCCLLLIALNTYNRFTVLLDCVVDHPGEPVR